MILLALVVAYFGFLNRKPEVEPEVFEDALTNSTSEDVPSEDLPTSSEEMDSPSEDVAPTTEEVMVTSEDVPESTIDEVSDVTSEEIVETSPEESEPTSEEILEPTTAEEETTMIEEETTAAVEETTFSEEEPTSVEEPEPTSVEPEPTTVEPEPETTTPEPEPTTVEPGEPYPVPDGATVTIGSDKIQVNDHPTQTVILNVQGNVNLKLHDANVDGVVIQVNENAKLTITDEPAEGWSADLWPQSKTLDVELQMGNVAPFNVIGSGTVNFLTVSQQSISVKSLEAVEININVDADVKTVEAERVSLEGSLEIKAQNQAQLLAGGGILLKTRELVVKAEKSAVVSHPYVLGTITIEKGASLQILDGADINGAEINVNVEQILSKPVLSLEFDCTTLGGPKSVKFVPESTKLTDLKLASGLNLDSDAWQTAVGSKYTVSSQSESDTNTLFVSTKQDEPGKSPTTIIVVVVILLLLVVIIICVVVVVIKRKQRNADRHARMEEDDSLAETDIDEVVEFKDPEKQTDKAANQDAFMEMSQDINPWAVDRIDPATMFDDDSDI